MVGKFIAWLLSKAGYVLMTPHGRLGDLGRFKDIENRLEELDQKLIELDGVVCTTMECVEEIRDMQHPIPEKREDSNNLAAIFSEYLNGAQPKRSDEE